VRFYLPIGYPVADVDRIGRVDAKKCPAGLCVLVARLHLAQQIMILFVPKTAFVFGAPLFVEHRGHQFILFDVCKLLSSFGSKVVNDTFPFKIHSVFVGGAYRIFAKLFALT